MSWDPRPSVNVVTRPGEQYQFLRYGDLCITLNTFNGRYEMLVEVDTDDPVGHRTVQISNAVGDEVEWDL